MREKQLNLGFLFLFFCLVLAGCISVPRSFHAATYDKKKQNVYLTKNYFYHVGPLSKEWRQDFLRNKPGIYFHNKVTKANITTQAICGPAYEDLPLRTLTQQLVEGLQNVKVESQKNWMLGERAALYTLYSAALDGVPVKLNIVVIKKDKCEFDFWAVSSPATVSQTSADFEDFVKGFDY